jgi:hypothetical protein
MLLTRSLYVFVNWMKNEIKMGLNVWPSITFCVFYMYKRSCIIMENVDFNTLGISNCF